MRCAVWHGMSDVLRHHATSRQVLAARGAGEIDDAALEARLREVEANVAALRAGHWAIDMLVRALGHAAWPSRSVRFFLLLLAASWWLRTGAG